MEGWAPDLAMVFELCLHRIPAGRVLFISLSHSFLFLPFFLFNLFFQVVLTHT